MAQHADPAAQSPNPSAGSGPTGIYLNPMAQRRDEFAAACGALFARLDVADSTEACTRLLDAGPPDLLVVDLDRFEPSLDLAALDALVARQGATTLLLCPSGTVGWLPALMAGRASGYAITPLDAASLRERVRQALARTGGEGAVDDAATDAAARLRSLLDLRARVERALAAAGDAHGFADELCAALRTWPGVAHAALVYRKEGANLRLEAQDGKPGLLLGALLGRTEDLLHAPLRHAFPALAAAVSGEPVLLEALDQCGEPALAGQLREHGVAMAAGLPIPADGPGPARGALSLLFDVRRAFSYDELALFADLARLAAFGLRLAETAHENEELMARLTHVSTIDALTGAANRRHGEDLLDKEIRRARRYGLPLALVAFDVDRFRAINETYGYPVGDVALRTVADAALAVLRASDVLVRSGGEEFHIIAPHTSAIDGLRMAEKVRHAIAQTAVPGCDRLTVSLGVAQLGEQESGDSLTQRVDAALARAKRAGRNCVELAMQ